MKHIAHIHEMKEQQLNRDLHLLVIVGFFALMASLARVVISGWNIIMFLHIGAYLIFLALVVTKRLQSFKVRAYFILAIPFVLGVAGLFMYGLLSQSFVAFFAFSVIAALLFGTRAGTIATAFSIAFILLFGGAVHMGIIDYSFDVNLYLTSFMSWLFAALVIALTAGLIVMSIGNMNKKMVELFQELESRNNDLSVTNKRLKEEISERKLLEEKRLTLEARLQRARKMEMMGTLAGGVAHDLNNVLCGLISYPDVLLAKLPRDSDFIRPIKNIQKSGQKAAAIVDDLLTVARGALNKREVINLNIIVSEYLISTECEKLLSYHPEVKIGVRLDDTLSNIMGSPIHIYKTIMNLVSNAAEATKSGGKILISTKDLILTKSITGYEEIKKGKYVTITVTDTGQGIPPDNISRIFEPFYTSKVLGRSGTGLGMAVVWNTIKDHEGYIDIDSSLGRGTEFTLYFPMTDNRKIEEPSTSNEDGIKGSGESLLVVDDMTDQRYLLRDALSDLDYSVHTVNSGEDAVSYIQRHKVELLILDMVMDPGIDGVETYRQILEINPDQKAIIVSGFTETKKVEELKKLGVEIFLQKPFRLEEIAGAIRAELEN